MNGILEELGTLGDVHHGCIIKDGNILATTFPPLLSDNLALIARISDRIFKGADSINCSYNEIYFEMGENYLLGFPVEGGLMVLLLTGKNVNLALIHMTIQSAAPQISSELSGSVPKNSAPRLTHQNNKTEKKIDPGLKPYLNEILEALTLRIGGVARISMAKGLKLWRGFCEPTKHNLPVLIDILAQEIEDDQAQQDFLDSLATLLTRELGSS